MCLWWGPSRTAESSSRTGSAGAGLLFTNVVMSANEEALSGTVGELVFPGLHIKARAKHPAYPERFPVIDELVPWSTPAPGYRWASGRHNRAERTLCGPRTERVPACHDCRVNARRGVAAFYGRGPPARRM